MNELKPRGVPFVMDGRGELRLLFTLNVVEELQEEFEEPLSEIINDLVEEDDAARPTLKKIMKVLLNDAVQRESKGQAEEVTEQEVGWLIGLDNWADMFKIVARAYGVSIPDADEDADPNAKSGRQKK